MARYRLTISRDEWPKSAWSAKMFGWLRKNCIANVCRKSCGLYIGTPARAQIRLKTKLMALRVRAWPPPQNNPYIYSIHYFYPLTILLQCSNIKLMKDEPLENRSRKMTKKNLWTVTDLDRKLWKGIYQDYSDKNLLLEIDFLNARAVFYADDRWALKGIRYRMLILMTEIARRGLKVTQEYIFN